MTKTRPRIGITTYHRNEQNIFTLPAYYVDAVRRAGGLPLLLPPGEEGVDEALSLVDGLILSGGGDIDPAHYDGYAHETIYTVSQERDQTELALVPIMIRAGKPLFCICRGIQLLNVALGGTLIEHVPDVVDNTVLHRADPPGPIPHPVTVTPDSRLGQIMQAETVQAASWHHQAIRRLAPGLTVTGRAPDGVIEAVEMPDHPWLFGVQWHPELTAADDPSQQRLFEALVKAAEGNLLTNKP